MFSDSLRPKMRVIFSRENLYLLQPDSQRFYQISYLVHLRCVNLAVPLRKCWLVIATSWRHFSPISAQGLCNFFCSSFMLERQVGSLRIPDSCGKGFLLDCPVCMVPEFLFIFSFTQVMMPKPKLCLIEHKCPQPKTSSHTP